MKRTSLVTILAIGLVGMLFAQAKGGVTIVGSSFKSEQRTINSEQCVVSSVMLSNGRTVELDNCLPETIQNYYTAETLFESIGADFVGTRNPFIVSLYLDNQTIVVTADMGEVNQSHMQLLSAGTVSIGPSIIAVGPLGTGRLLVAWSTGAFNKDMPFDLRNELLQDYNSVVFLTYENMQGDQIRFSLQGATTSNGIPLALFNNEIWVKISNKPSVVVISNTQARANQYLDSASSGYYYLDSATDSVTGRPTGTETVLRFFKRDVDVSTHTFNIDSSPTGSVVYVAGPNDNQERKIGRTPYTFTGPAGNYTFRFKRNGYEAVEKHVTTRWNQASYEVSTTLTAYAWISVRQVGGNPNDKVKVSVNGEALGVPPITRTKIDLPNGLAQVVTSSLVSGSRSKDYSLTPGHNYELTLVEPVPLKPKKRLYDMMTGYEIPGWKVPSPGPDLLPTTKSIVFHQSLLQDHNWTTLGTILLLSAGTGMLAGGIAYGATVPEPAPLDTAAQQTWAANGTTDVLIGAGAGAAVALVVALLPLGHEVTKQVPEPKNVAANESRLRAWENQNKAIEEYDQNLLDNANSVIRTENQQIEAENRTITNKNAVEQRPYWNLKDLGS